MSLSETPEQSSLVQLSVTKMVYIRVSQEAIYDTIQLMPGAKLPLQCCVVRTLKTQTSPGMRPS